MVAVLYPGSDKSLKLDALIDIVSKNGCALLNVGPGPDGSIPGEAREILLDMGKWLKLNGEAIYGTRPWKIFGEGPTAVPGGQRVRREQDYTSKDIRFTQKPDVIYAIVMAWPDAAPTCRGSIRGYYMAIPPGFSPGLACVFLIPPKRGS